MSIHPTDQAYLAVLDDEILHALAGAEKVPEYGSTNGFMIPVRAIIKVSKPHHPFYELTRDLESHGFSVGAASSLLAFLVLIAGLYRDAFWAAKAREWDQHKADLIACADVDEPYVTSANINRLLAGVRGILGVVGWVQRAYSFGHPGDTRKLRERALAVLQQWEGFERKVLEIEEMGYVDG